MPEPLPDSPLDSLAAEAAATGRATRSPPELADHPRSRPAPTGRRAAGSGASASAPGYASAGSSSSSEPRCSRPILPLDDPNDTLGGVIANKGFGAAATCSAGDSSGRDLLSRTIFGARNSLTVGFGAIIIGTVIGGLLGAPRRTTHGYCRGRIDTFIVGPARRAPLRSRPSCSRSPRRGAPGPRLGPADSSSSRSASSPSRSWARITSGDTRSYWSQREFVMAARAPRAPRTGRIMDPAKCARTCFRRRSRSRSSVCGRHRGGGGARHARRRTCRRSRPTWGNIINDGRAI